MSMKDGLMKRDRESALPPLSRVLGYLVVKDICHEVDRYPLLERLGYGVREIAVICGSTPEWVQKVLREARRKR